LPEKVLLLTVVVAADPFQMPPPPRFGVSPKK
jgi:hypothetical protein